MLSEQTSGAARSDQEWHHSVSSLGPLAGQGTLGAVIVDLPEIGEETAYYNIYAGTRLTLVLGLSPKAFDMMISLFLPGVYRVHEPCCSFSYLN